MITLNKPSFIFLNEDTQTSKKVDSIFVNTNRFAVNNQGAIQGYVTSILIGENSSSLPFTEITQKDDKYKGKDVVGELHKEYIEILSTLNPDIIFTDTYNK